MVKAWERTAICLAVIFCTGVPAMRTALVIGGLPLANQLHRLRSGVQVRVYV